MAKIWQVSVTIMVVGALFFLFQNCSGHSDKGSDAGALCARPEKLCGEEGFRYMLDTYFIPHCAACHKVGGLAHPPFADHNLEISFKYAFSIPKENFIKKSTENDLCAAQGCNLIPGEPRYQDLVEWLDSPRFCDE